MSTGPSLAGTGNPAWEPLPHGRVSVHSVAFLPYMESVFEEVFRVLEVSGQWVESEGERACVRPAHSRHIPSPLSHSALT